MNGIDAIQAELGGTLIPGIDTSPYPSSDDKDHELRLLKNEYNSCRRTLWERFGRGMPNMDHYNRERAALDSWYALERKRIVDRYVSRRRSA